MTPTHCCRAVFLRKSQMWWNLLILIVTNHILLEACADASNVKAVPEEPCDEFGIYTRIGFLQDIVLSVLPYIVAKK